MLKYDLPDPLTSIRRVAGLVIRLGNVPVCLLLLRISSQVKKKKFLNLSLKILNTLLIVYISVWLRVCVFIPSQRREGALCFYLGLHEGLTCT